MLFKNGSGWKACFDQNNGRYFGEYGGIQSYHLFELTKELFDRLDEKMTEGTTWLTKEGNRLPPTGGALKGHVRQALFPGGAEKEKKVNQTFF